MLREHLWIKVMVPVCAVLFIVIGLMIAINVNSQTNNVHAQTRHQSEMMATAVEGGMFDALAVGDNATVVRQFQRLRKKTEGVDVYVFDFNRDVAFSTREDAKGKRLDSLLSDPAKADLVVEMIRTGMAPEAPLEESFAGIPYQSVLRPIFNQKRCFHCHGSSRKVLGGIQVRSSIEHALAGAERARNVGIIIGLAGITVLSISIFGMFILLVNRPVRRLLDLGGRMRQGDLSHKVKVVGRDEISHISARMNLVNKNLRNKIGEIKTSSALLADLSSNQAANVEETSSSLEEMATHTKQNAENASGADQLMKAVQEVVQVADVSMDNLIVSMGEINQSSKKVSQIIKTIDEIAFQTNPLALKAAVEAARAGQAGAGFAVVADEVRNLAIRAADAARTTAELIDDTVQKIKNGSTVADSVNNSFSEMASRTSKACDLVKEISAASAEQSKGIQYINQSISEIGQGIQKTATSAEELSTNSGTFKLEQEYTVAPVSGITVLPRH